MSTCFGRLAVELVERIASFLPCRDLKTFRLLDSKCAAAGFKPSLEYMPSAVNLSTLERRDLGSKRGLRHLMDVSATPAIAKTIYSLTVGRGSANIDLLCGLHLPTLSQFRLERIDVVSSNHIVEFLSNNIGSLRNIVIRNVAIICSFDDTPRTDTIPDEWQNIFLTIQSLPHLTAVVFADLGFRNAKGTNTYRLWVQRTQFCGSRSPRVYGMDCGEGYDNDALINGHEVRARARQAVDRAIEAISNSIGTKVLKYTIPLRE